MNLIFIAISVGLLFLVGFLLAVYAFGRRTNALERLAADATESETWNWRNYFVRAEVALKSLGQAIPRSPDELSRQGRRLAHAGIRRRDGAVLFVGIQGGVALALVFAFSVAGMMGQNPILYLILSVFAGALLPDMWLRRMISSRKEQIQHGLPDALDLTVVCVEAGLGLDQSLMRIGQELKQSCPALCEELGLVTLEVNAGKTRSVALRNLALRTDVEDVKALAAILIQTDRFGTSIGQSLRGFAANLRVKRRQRAEERAAKIPVKMIPAMVVFIFPSIMIVVAGPAVISMANNLLPFLAPNR